MAGRYKVCAKEDRTADGVVFDSGHEKDQYLALKALYRAGTITDLELQPRFPLVVNGVKVCEYIADFRCKDASGRISIYDAKGHRDALYRLKYKLFHACYPDLRIVEL